MASPEAVSELNCLVGLDSTVTKLLIREAFVLARYLFLDRMVIVRVLTFIPSRLNR